MNRWSDGPIFSAPPWRVRFRLFLHFATRVAALLDHDSSVFRSRVNLRACRAQAEYLVALIPGSLRVIADSVLADDRRVVRSYDLEASVEVPGYGDNQTAIMRPRIETFPFPAFRQADGKSSILHVGVDLAAAILDRNAAVLGFRREFTGAPLKRDTAV